MFAKMFGIMVLTSMVGCETPARKAEVETAGVAVSGETPKSVKEKETKVSSRTLVPDEPTTNPGQHGVVVPPSVKKGEITSVDIEQLFMMKGDGTALVVDVRPTFFYKMGHIDGAISMPLKTFESSYPQQRPQLDEAKRAGKVLVLYCANAKCPDGYAVAKKLAADGYASSVFKGGWSEWKSAGLE